MSVLRTESPASLIQAALQAAVRAARARRPVAWLAALTAATMFWSTALLELCSALLLIQCARTWIAGRYSSGGPTTTGIRRPLAIALAVLWSVYAAGVLCSILFSLSPPVSIGFSAKLWHALLFPAVLAAGLTNAEIRFAGKAFLLSACAAALAAASAPIIGYHMLLGPGVIGRTTYADFSALAGILGTGIVLAAVNGEKGGDPRARIVLGSALTLPAVLAVFFSALRAPVLVLVFFAAVLVGLSRPRAVISVALGATALLLVSPRSLWYKFLWLADGNTIDRYPLWKAGLSLIHGLPVFGYGPDTYALIIPTVTWSEFMNRPPASWHNDFLETLLGSGWITLSGFASLLVCVCACGLWAASRSRSRSDRWQATVITAMLLGLAIFSLESSVVSTAVAGTMLWLLLAFAASLVLRENSDA